MGGAEFASACAGDARRPGTSFAERQGALAQVCALGPNEQRALNLRVSPIGAVIGLLQGRSQTITWPRIWRPGLLAPSVPGGQ